jgi:hypothetical protein
MVRIVYGLTVIVTMDHRRGDFIAGLPEGSPAMFAWGGSESTTGRGGRLRLIRRLAGSTPNKTDTDSSDMVAMISVVIGLVQSVKKPFVTIAESQVRLVR